MVVAMQAVQAAELVMKLVSQADGRPFLHSCTPPRVGGRSLAQEAKAKNLFPKLCEDRRHNDNKKTQVNSTPYKTLRGGKAQERLIMIAPGRAMDSFVRVQLFPTIETNLSQSSPPRRRRILACGLCASPKGDGS